MRTGSVTASLARTSRHAVSIGSGSCDHFGKSSKVMPAPLSASCEESAHKGAAPRAQGGWKGRLEPHRPAQLPLNGHVQSTSQRLKLTFSEGKPTQMTRVVVWVFAVKKKENRFSLFNNNYPNNYPCHLCTFSLPTRRSGAGAAQHVHSATRAQLLEHLWKEPRPLVGVLV